MTRAEAIAIIEKSIRSADDAALEAAAQLLDSASGDDGLPRLLTVEEFASIEQAREDFKAGRTFTSAQGQAYIDAALAQRRAQRAAKV